MNTRRELSDLVFGGEACDPMGRPLSKTRRKMIARFLAKKLADPQTFASEYEKWAAEIENGTLDLGDVARAIDEIQQMRASGGRFRKGPGAIFNYRRREWLKRKGA